MDSKYGTEAIMYKCFFLITFFAILLLGGCSSGIRTPTTPTPENATIIPMTSQPTSLPNTATVTPTSEPALKLISLHDWTLYDSTVESVGDIHWAPDSSKFVVTNPYSTSPLAVYDVKTYAKLWDDNLRSEVYSASASIFSQDGQFIYAGLAFPVGVQVRDAKNGEVLSTGEENYHSNCPAGRVYSIALSKDGHMLYFLVEDNIDKTVTYSDVVAWNIASLKCVGTLVKTKGYAKSLVVSPNGRFLAISISEGLSSYLTDNLAEKGHTVILDIETNKEICTVTGAPVVFEPGNTTLIAFESKREQNSWINKITNWDIEQCKYINDLTQVVPPEYILPPVSIMPDGKILGIGQTKIRLLDTDTGKILFETDNPSLQTSDDLHRMDILSFSPDGNFLLFATRKGIHESVIRLWKIEK
jgi:hypothetical protein